MVCWLEPFGQSQPCWPSNSFEPLAHIHPQHHCWLGGLFDLEEFEVLDRIGVEVGRIWSSNETLESYGLSFGTKNKN